MKIASPEYRYQHLGSVYRLIEQFELISRTDLAKLSGFAPASMTALTKLLIEKQFILERTSQNIASRGRPAVGLSLSPFYWSQLCLTLSSRKLTVSLCRLDSSIIYRKDYLFTEQHYTHLTKLIVENLQIFMQECRLDLQQLLAVSVSVLGKINQQTGTITQLGYCTIECPLENELKKLFTQPVLINEHFQLWFITESVLGNLIGDDDVIYLQLDTDINLSVQLQGKVFQQDEHKRMNVDKMLMPTFAMSDEIAEDISVAERYQLHHQVTFTPLAKLIDRHLPNSCVTLQEKITWFCECVEQNNPNAMRILNHIADNLAYMLMNLINLFSTRKVMLNSPLQRIKQPLFQQIENKLRSQLLLGDLQVDLVTSQYDWDCPHIPAVAVKLALYNGELFRKIIDF